MSIVAQVLTRFPGRDHRRPLSGSAALQILEWRHFCPRRHVRRWHSRFQVLVPEEYPELCPSVRFLTDIYHPLVSANGHFVLQHQFSGWRPRKDYICHVLHYIKQSFKEHVLMNLDVSLCPNKECVSLLQTDKAAFERQASRFVQSSKAGAALYDRSVSGLKFSPISDQRLARIKMHILSGAMAIPDELYDDI